MKTISLLGSTGSIGTQTLDMVTEHSADFSVAGLTVHRNTELLLKQIEQFKPEAVAVMDMEVADSFESSCPVTLYKGSEGVKKIATLDSCDTVVNALVGSVGVEPTYSAIMNGKNIALANKETLVTAGQVIMDVVKKKEVSLTPIDSEHSAIMQCLEGQNQKEVSKLLITCSGGPFRDASLEQMQSFTIKDALAHPTWNMGAKITVDSSTLMNKGFEVIEARWLFDIDYNQIEVVIHPQSIIHSLVEFVDKSVLAQLGMPDMRIPIQYALSYPKRLPRSGPQLNLTEIGKLEFNAPDLEKFSCLQQAFTAGKAGGVKPAALNAANEVAVAAFIDGTIGYLDICRLVKEMVDATPQQDNPSLSDLLAVDAQVKEKTQKKIEEGL